MSFRTNSNTFRWGILGTGYAAKKFVLGLQKSSSGKAAMVASRNRGNAEIFAYTFSIPQIADSYASGATEPEVDAFYIATPPTTHLEIALLCIAAGKPVLIEKPIAHNVADASAIIEASRKNQVFCMEGMWTRFLPLVAHIKEMVKEGRIGTPLNFSGSFGIANVPDLARSVFNPHLGGGAMLHRGIYPLSMAYYLLGVVEEISSSAVIGKTNVDEDSALILRHKNGGISTISASLRASLPNNFMLTGTHGSIHVDAPIYRPYRLKLSKTIPANRLTGISNSRSFRESNLVQSVYQRLHFFTDRIFNSSQQTISKYYQGNGYHYEADELMRCVREGLAESPMMPLSESLEISTIIEKARGEWS